MLIPDWLWTRWPWLGRIKRRYGPLERRIEDRLAGCWRLFSRRHWLFRTGLVIGLALIVFEALSGGALSRFFADPGAFNDETAAIRNVALTVFGIPLFAIALWRTVQSQRQLELAERGHLNDRYQKGADMLGSPVLATRLGGIYALELLAKEHPDAFHLQVVKMFCSFVRHPTPDEELPLRETVKSGHFLCRSDVEAAMTAIGERSKKGREVESKALYSLDLQGAVLNGINIAYGVFDNADFSGAEMIDVFAVATNMRGTSFVDADLRRANFDVADLTSAYFKRGKLAETIFNDADITSAVFSDFEKAGLTQNQLDDARALEAHPPRIASTLMPETGETILWDGGRGNPIYPWEVSPEG